MSRCEHEIINKIDSENVVDLLVILQPASCAENQASAEAQKAIAKEIFKKCNKLLGVDEENQSNSDDIDSQQADAQSSNDDEQVDENEELPQK